MGFLRRWFQRFTKGTVEAEAMEIPRENPYLPYIREILEELLARRGLAYGQMRLLLIDVDAERESLFEEDNAEVVLEHLSPDLNFLTILTDRPEYFQSYVERMYEENGLLVSLSGKERLADVNTKEHVNTVVDLEGQGRLYPIPLREPSIYLPIFKRSWKTAENLDIYVPIGYNTVIVKGFSVVEKEEGCKNSWKRKIS